MGRSQRERARAAWRRYYWRHRDEMLARLADYYALNRERVCARMRAYRRRTA